MRMDLTMTKTISYFKARKDGAIVNRETMVSTYNGDNGYNMIIGMPMIVSIEGTYVDSRWLNEQHIYEYDNVHWRRDRNDQLL